MPTLTFQSIPERVPAIWRAMSFVLSVKKKKGAESKTGETSNLYAAAKTDGWLL